MVDASTAMQFATPIAVIIGAILNHLNARKADIQAVKAATERQDAASKQQVISAKVDEVHTLTNSRLSELMTEVADLKEKLAHNQISSMDDRLSRIEASSTAAANAANKAANIIGSK